MWVAVDQKQLDEAAGEGEKGGCEGGGWAIPKIEHVTGFTTFQVQRALLVVFREIRQENKTPPTMAKQMAVHFAKLRPPWRQAYQIPCNSGSARTFKCPPSGPDGAEILIKSSLAAQFLAQLLLAGP